MIKINEALKTVLRGIDALGHEDARLLDSLGRVVFEDIYSGSDIPAFDNSAMDGYAVRSLDTHGVSVSAAKTMEVIDSLKAGYPAKKVLNRNQAIKIMTGAAIPMGADSVVMVEDTVGRRDEGTVEVRKDLKRGENIRRTGEDIKKGELVVRKGTLLKAAHIGVLASLGISRIKVTRKPRVAILATGDEVVDIGRKLTPGKLYSSNTYALYSQVIRCGAIPENLGIAKDRPHELESKIRKGLHCDMILTSGGVSMGEYDLVKSVLAGMGTDIKFWKVAMRPGKPLVFGHIKGIPVFGLPGNPVSSMVSFEIFVKPAILKMLGREQRKDGNNEAIAVLGEDIKKRKGLIYFLRANTAWNGSGYSSRTTGPQGSGILKSMALANSLIILPEGWGDAKKGKKVTVRFLD